MDEVIRDSICCEDLLNYCKGDSSDMSQQTDSAYMLRDFGDRFGKLVTNLGHAFKSENWGIRYLLSQFTKLSGLSVLQHKLDFDKLTPLELLITYMMRLR